jgi:uncharacterized protein YbjT (DUF2867 family)
MASTILIAGPPGAIGQFLVRELLSQGHAVRILVRERSRVMATANGTGPDVVEAPVPSVSVLDAIVDDITHLVLLSAPAPNQVLWNGALVEAAERTGRPIHIVPVLAMGAVSDDPALQFAHWHAATVAQIRSTGLPMTEIRPQLLMQTLLCTAPAIRTDDLVFGAYGGSRLPQVDAADVAAAITTVLTTDGHDGQSYVLTGPQSISHADLAAVLTTTLGRPIRYVDLPAEAFHEHLLGNGVPAWEADDLAVLGRLFQSDHTWPVTSTLAELTGRPAHTLQRFVREHAAAFRAPHTLAPVREGTLPTPFLI